MAESYAARVNPLATAPLHAPDLVLVEPACANRPFAAH